MKTNAAVGALLLAMIAGSGGFVTGLSAQAKPQFAYFVAEATVTNQEEDARIIRQLPVTAEALGGHYIVRGGKIVAYSGEPPQRIIIVAFDSLEKIRAWRELPKVRELEAERKEAGTTLRTYAVEGVTQ
jgi:uncharacterized protein (DUF1330 family)